MTAELLQPEELVSGIICQVAAEPELAPLLSSFVYNTKGAPSALRGWYGQYLRMHLNSGGTCFDDCGGDPVTVPVLSSTVRLQSRTQQII